MSAFPPTATSPLVRSLEELKQCGAAPQKTTVESPADPDTEPPLDICTHLAASPDKILFLSGANLYHMQDTLRDVNRIWQKEGRPAMAVCAFPDAAASLKHATGIKSVGIDRFLNVAMFAHRVVTSPGTEPRYVVRRTTSTLEKRDYDLIPPRVNLIVHQPHAMAPSQLKSLFDHATGVHGRLILCDNAAKLKLSHPDLYEALKTSLHHELALHPNAEYARPHADSVAARRHSSPIRLSRQSDSNRVIPQHMEQAALGGLGEPRASRAYLVFHSQCTRPAIFPDDYRLVARVDANSLAEAVGRTQHFGKPWPENPGVDCFVKQPRSTQPGDVLIHRDTAHYVDVNGFRPVGMVLQPEMTQRAEPAPIRQQRSARKIKP